LPPKKHVEDAVAPWPAALNLFTVSREIKLQVVHHPEGKDFTSTGYVLWWIVDGVWPPAKLVIGFHNLFTVITHDPIVRLFAEYQWVLR
jgi:hypothetical protein